MSSTKANGAAPVPNSPNDPVIVEETGPNHWVASVAGSPEPRVGILLRGGCDLPTLFVMASMIKKALAGRGEGSCCIVSSGIGISDSRPDILLQSLQGVPFEHVNDVVNGDAHRIGKLDIDYFKPHLFAPTITVPGWNDFDFPKSVVVLSLGPAVMRTAYVHREHGYIIDPGGFWLNQAAPDVIKNTDTARWFQRTFSPIGRMHLEQFERVFPTLVHAIRESTHAHVLVMNTLVVEPRAPFHNYQMSPQSVGLRRRLFDVATRVMAPAAGYQIIDVDRILKLEGVAEQVDPGHYETRHMRPIAEEGFRMIAQLGLF